MCESKRGSNSARTDRAYRNRRLPDDLGVVIPILVVVILALSAGSVSLKEEGLNSASVSALASSETGPTEAGPGIVCGCVCAHTCGGGGCPFVYYTIYIYNQLYAGESAAVVINGTYYVNGALVGFCSTIRYTISAAISTPFSDLAFRYWYVTEGSVASQSSPTTTFTPGTIDEESAAIVLVLGPASDNIENWGGYVGGGSHISEAWGEFDIPTGTYYQVPNCDYTDTMAIWVGIGGVNGNTNLWQAGVQIQITPESNCHSALTMEEWYEAAPNPVQFVGGSPCDGSGYPFLVQVGINSTGAWANYGSCGMVQISGVQFKPDQTTAEWVVEASGVLPNFPSIGFFDCGYTDGKTTYTTFAAPIEAQVLTDEALYNTFPYYIDQFVTPSYVNQAAFTEQYSQAGS
jgi:hypothetical protein